MNISTILCCSAALICTSFVDLSAALSVKMLQLT